MDSDLTMFFDQCYALQFFSKWRYTEIDHDLLRRLIRIEQTNFAFSCALQDKYEQVNLSILRLN